MGTGGRQNGANSPIDSWQHEHEGGAEREAMASRHTLTTGSAHCTVKRRGSGWEPGRTKLPNPRSPDAFRRRITRGGGWGGVTIGRAEASIGLPPRALRIPPYHCCRPAFRHHPLRRTDKILCRCFGAPATLRRRAGFSPDHLISKYALLVLLYSVAASLPSPN